MTAASVSQQYDLRTALTVRNAIEHLQIQVDAGNAIMLNRKGKPPAFCMNNDFIAPRTWLTHTSDGEVLLAVCRIPILLWFPEIPWGHLALLKNSKGVHMLVFETPVIEIPAEKSATFSHSGCVIPPLSIGLQVAGKVFDLLKGEQRIGLATFAYTSTGMIDLSDSVSQYVSVLPAEATGETTPQAKGEQSC